MRTYAPSIPPGRIKLGLAEYLELPNDGNRYQILDGELDVTPAPSTRHQRVLGRLFAALRELEVAGLGEVMLAPTDVLLDDHNIVQPDLIFVRKDRLGIIGPQRIEGAPDLVVEVLSPSTRRTDVLTKSKLYARFGIPEYWIADPDIDRLERFVRRGDDYELAQFASSPDTLRPEGWEPLELKLREVFVVFA